MMVYLAGLNGRSLLASSASVEAFAGWAVIRTCAKLALNLRHDVLGFPTFFVRFALLDSNFVLAASVESSMNRLITATLRSLLNSWIGFRKVVLDVGRRMVAFRSLTAL